MSFFRSDSVNHYKMILPRESAWRIMDKLGQLQLIHIIPNNAPVLTRPFLHQVKRCDQSLQKLYNLQSLLIQKKICQIPQQYSKQSYAEIYKIWEQGYKQSKKNEISILNDIVNEVDQSWNYYLDLNKRMETLQEKIDFIRQNMAILRAGQKQFGRSFFATDQYARTNNQHLSFKDSTKINFKTGVINISDQLRFQKTVFRITKGNCLISCIPFTSIFQSMPKQQQTKVVFFVLFPVKQNTYFQKKLSKLIQNFCDKKYQLPQTMTQFQPQVKLFQGSYVEAQNLLSLSQKELESFLFKLAETTSQINFIKKIQNLKLYVLKEKQIYNKLNEMDIFNNFLRGQIFVRKDDVQSLQQVLTSIERNTKLPAGQLVNPNHSQKLPTHFIRNTYTSPAQQIVQTYGVARYKQANPSYFTTITFPFLFGVMFGDIAHGTILFGFGLYIVFNWQKIQNGLLKILIPYRYLITLMGFFALYCGFIYNDFLSISLNLFGSCYDPETVSHGQPIPRSSEECMYAFGLDPVWSVSENNLNYVNSMKMKISVIIAVVHMTLGVFVKATNALYFKKYMQLVFEFIPQLAFMIVLFGYMDFLIIYKWNVNWGFDNPNAPSIITTMINLPLKLGGTDSCCGGQPMWGQYGNTTQDNIQLWLFVIAAISVPLMLLPKPLYQIYCNNQKNQSKSLSEEFKQEGALLLRSSQSIDLSKIQKSSHDHQQHDASQIFVHQIIQTIEYVLGCISNTASYLRLWALSLAHSQLSEVFFQKSVQGSLASGFSGIPMNLFGFIILASATLGVLLGMDSMQCFLHTLRLHWVQFQNKFYKGDGFGFIFYSFSTKSNQQMRLRTL